MCCQNVWIFVNFFEIILYCGVLSGLFFLVWKFLSLSLLFFRLGDIVVSSKNVYTVDLWLLLQCKRLCLRSEAV